MKKAPLLLALFLVGFSFDLLAQSRQIVNQPIQWFAITSNLKLSSKFTLLVDGQFRFVQGFEGMQHQIRLGGDFKVNDQWSVMPLGYVAVANPVYGLQPASYSNIEHRLFQQVQFKHYSGKVRFQHRFRVEERFIETKRFTNGVQTDEDFSTNEQLRIRYRALMNIPLNNEQAGSYAGGFDPKTWYLQIYDEIFMSWGKSAYTGGADQNRVFIGAGYQFSKKVAMTGGVFWQMLVKSQGTKQENNIGTSINLSCNFDLTKPAK